MSISGPAPSSLPVNERMKRNFFRNAPHLIEKFENLQKHVYPRTYKFLYVNPWEAKNTKEWASFQLGKKYQMVPLDLKQEFGWRSSGLVPKRAKNIMRDWVPPIVWRHTRKLLLKSRGFF